MGFAEEMRKAGNFTRTENGASALGTTGNACLDFFGVAGSLRGADEARICALFEEAFQEDALLATKIVFYARDIRGGLGERATFRILLAYMAKKHPGALVPNLDLVGVFGRYDDLYCLVGTPCEDAMWAAMKTQFEEDLKNLHEGRALSFLAKWIKTADASSKDTRRLGILTAQKLGYPVYHFKRIVRSMRKNIRVVECLMSQNRWDEILYPKVPSRAMMIYRNAFMRHDGERFKEFVGKAAAGEVKINSSALYPYDIVEKILYQKEDSPVLQAQWQQLPDYVQKGTNAIVMADVSGSMYGRPMATAIGLAIYFAERNTGAYHNLFMTFSGSPQIVTLKGQSLAQKINNVSKADWCNNTSLELAFLRVLEIAIAGHVPPEEMPKSILVISDMEIDSCGDRKWTFYEQMEARYKEAGYGIPNVVFWNVASRHDVFHADHKRRGVQLCSGQSAAVFGQVLSCIGCTPVEMMHKVVDSKRYACVSVETEWDKDWGE
ncbi:MAG: DUF2828 family protein [Lachnospiraceae bacterium]|nr:DUF2828 family protein [Lachnospiraceae bacterium]